MWRALVKQAKRLAQEGYSWEEVREILRKAAELQAQAERDKESYGQVNKDALKAGAMAAGIRPEFIEQALQEFHARRRKHRDKQSQARNWGKLTGWALAGILVGILGLPVILLVFGTLTFAFSVTFFVLLVVGLALGVAAAALLFASPFLGLGFLIGLAAVIGHALGKAQGKKWQGRHWRYWQKWRGQHWRHWFGDDD